MIFLGIALQFLIPKPQLVQTFSTVVNVQLVSNYITPLFLYIRVTQLSDSDDKFKQTLQT